MKIKNPTRERLLYALIEMQKEISFYDDEHLYFYKRKPCLSVTTLIKEYKQEFDSVKIANEVVKNRNSKYFRLNPVDIVKEWNQNSKDACEKGTKIHRMAELISMNLDSHIPETEYKGYLFQIYQFFSKYKVNTLLPEIVVYDKHSLIAGMIDLVSYNSYGKIDLWDWKTNKKIDLFNKYSQYMQKELNHLDDCEFIHYSLQLSIYKVLFGWLGFEVENLNLVHLKEDSYDVIKCRDLTKEAKTIIEKRETKIKNEH